MATNASATNVPRVPEAIGKKPTGPRVAICLKIERIVVLQHTTNEMLTKDFVLCFRFDI